MRVDLAGKGPKTASAGEALGPTKARELLSEENRIMFYPNILRLLAHQHAVSLERAYRLWDQAAAHSTARVGLTPHETADWESVMSRFLESIR